MSANFCLSFNQNCNVSKIFVRNSNKNFHENPHVGFQIFTSREIEKKPRESSGRIFHNISVQNAISQV